MRYPTIIAALVAATSLTAPALAQVGDITSGSQSGAEANSGSQSGAQSDNNSSQGQQQNNAGIGNSVSGSASDSTSVSGSQSGAESNGNQQGQDQGQSQGLANTNQLGASQGNQQGVTFTQTYNTTSRRKTIQEFRTNAAVPLAASSSFSSDYCGGTASGGVSAAPIGISIGGAAPTFDKSCQSLRRAEKFGMAAANYANMNQPDMALKMMSMMVWSICTSDSKGPKPDLATAEACEDLLGSQASPPSPPPPPPAPAPEPQVQDSSGYPTPEAVERYKTPRGSLEYRSNPVIQEVPLSMADASTAR